MAVYCKHCINGLSVESTDDRWKPIHARKLRYTAGDNVEGELRRTYTRGLRCMPTISIHGSRVVGNRG